MPVSIGRYTIVEQSNWTVIRNELHIYGPLL